MKFQEYKRMYDREDWYWWYIAKRSYILTYLSSVRIRKSDNILDIGCGTGKTTELLQQFGRVSAIDHSPLAVSYCHKRGLDYVRTGSVMNPKFPPKSQMLITLFDVLYHKNVPDDLKALKNCHDLLKDGGYILITDCACQFLFGPHDLANQARQRYTKGELVKIIENAGFRTVRSSYIYFLTFPLFAAARVLDKLLPSSAVGEGTNNTFMNRCLITVCMIENLFLRKISFPFGSSILVLARKI